MKIRVGFGFDVHPLQKGKDFWLGGVRIPHHSGATGHSDADALIHAICDAILGAAALRDIGFQFPNTDPRFKGIDSKLLLEEVIRLIKKENYFIGNVDATVCLESPRINPFVPEMIKALTPVLQISDKDLSIKATTNEKMGYVGRQEGVAAYAVVLLIAGN